MQVGYDSNYGFLFNCTPEEAADYLSDPRKAIDLYKSLGFPEDLDYYLGYRFLSDFFIRIPVIRYKAMNNK